MAIDMKGISKTERFMVKVLKMPMIHTFKSFCLFCVINTGRFFFTNGDIFEGEFKGDLPNGQGKI